ncbi:50S ribosomal protein L15 [bacterium]|nr:MAG: 50S ribosomal protein L15 [bacterium]RKZ21553.1 MAG: 50S ribosomal protein L15 [bacterium]RKZ27265.1 MAG: 50S ribosomal protein L15 [bacterium]
MELHELKPPEGAVKKRKRVGRGPGSGKGKTAGRGTKGQRARSGGSLPLWFEGGQMPLTRRVPKRGFKNPNKVIYEVVNIKDLNRFEDGTVVDFEMLKKEGLVKKGPVKILGDGTLERKLEVHAHAFSKSALKAIEEKGGKAVRIGS